MFSSSRSSGMLSISIPCFDTLSVFVSSDFVSAILPWLDQIDGVVDPNLCGAAESNGFFLGQIFESKRHSIVISMCKQMNSFGIPPDP